MMKRVLPFASVAEALTGLALLIDPGLVGRLLLGDQLVGSGATVARVAGIALVALGIACWPGSPLAGMLIYSACVALYLAYLGLVAGSHGMLLWPAIILHGLLTALLMMQFLRQSQASGRSRLATRTPDLRP